MLSQYEIQELDNHDLQERKDKLENHPFSIIIEGGWLEFDSLNEWIRINLGSDLINWYAYGKTDYDFGFLEYFFADKKTCDLISETTPNIYAVYTKSYPPNLTEKTNGHGQYIKYSPNDKNAVVVRIENNEDKADNKT